MHYFRYRNNRLYAEEVPVETIAAEVGTPCYIYSRATLERHYRAFDRAFAGSPHLICYSQKANSNLAVLHLFGRMGGGTDIVSGGELFRALKAGIPPERIVYSGVGKTAEEIRFGLSKNILLWNVESAEELKLINEIAGQMKRKAPISLRVNPDIDPQTHPYISTGLKKKQVRHRHPAFPGRISAGRPIAPSPGGGCGLSYRLPIDRRPAFFGSPAKGEKLNPEAGGFGDRH